MLLQGGVSKLARRALMRDISNQNCAPDNFLVCPNESGEYDASVLGGIRSRDPSKLGAQVKRLWTFPLSDPTRNHPWSVEDLEKFYAIIAALQKRIDLGETVVVTCVAGKNRSRAICHALDPTMPEPMCKALTKAAKAVNDVDRLSLAPLFPERSSRSGKNKE